MKQLLLLLLVFYTGTLEAKNYYISAKGLDTNDGLTITSPWQTITKLNASFTSIAAGDSILFKCGETFYGSIIVGKSGTTSLPIVFGSYSTGALPLITGFTTLTNWTDMGGGIWKTNVASASTTLKVVSINNNLQRMGRYPNFDATNGGYLTYESINGSTPSITDNQLTTSNNWTGADAVIRKYSYITSVCPITNHSGGTLTYSNTDGNPGTAGNGYFIQNDIRTLDQFGEWFLNKSTKDLSVYFGSNNPSSYTIKASTTDILLNCQGGASVTGKINISVSNIAFEGANLQAFYSFNGTNISVKNCTFNNNYEGIYMWNVPNSLTQNNTVTNTLNSAIEIYAEGSSPSAIKFNTVRNVGWMTGMGGAIDDSYCGIVERGSAGTIENNIVDSVGYQGIKFNGANISVRYNLVKNYCATKDDGGGIYTYNDRSSLNRVIANNIVLDGIGAIVGRDGTDTRTSGIYLDGASHNIDVLYNTVAQQNVAASAARSGIFVNQGQLIRITGNTMYNIPKALEYNRYPQNAGSELMRNITETQNIMYPTVSNFFYWNGELNVPVVTTIQSDMRAIGTFDSNYVRNDLAAPFDYYYHLTAGGTFSDPAAQNFSQWQTFINGESHSKIIPTGTIIFQYNASNTSKTITLDAKYLGVDGTTVYNGTITLAPFTSAVLIKSGAIDVALKADAGTNISLIMPVNNTVLKGTAVGAVTGYSWRKISGPSQFTIATPTSPSTAISNLAVGIYTFQLKVVNSAGDSALSTVTVTQAGVLPVTLIDFTAQTNNDKVNLQWQVASEINVSHYAIERSNNGQDFENIGALDANNLANIQINYNFADNSPLKGTNYYRLVMVDIDGSIEYSKTVSVSVTNVVSFTLLNVALSASNSNIKTILHSNSQQVMHMVVADVNGRIIFTNEIQLQKGFNAIDKKIQAINTGIYYAKLFTNDLIITKAILSTR